MRKVFIILICSVLLIGSGCQAQTKNKELEEFVMDLSSANNKLRGKLRLFGEYKGDLSTMTYNRYLELLKKNESKSNEGTTAIIENADKHIFVAKKNSFLIAIYSKELNAVLYDDANTTMTDSIVILQKNQKVPDLTEFISKTEFKPRN
ncbi:MAG: hypothetical protein ACERIH_04700 [Labilibaculum antarcticum]